MLTSKDEEKQGDQGTVANVKHSSGQATELDLCNEVQEAVEEDVGAARASREERPPLPIVVLGAEQEIGHENGDGSADNDHETVAQEEETEHVIDPAEPDRAHDEVKLNEDGAKGKETDEQAAGKGLEISRDRGDLSGNLVRANRRLDSARAETKPGASEGEGQGDDEPDANNDEHGCEWNCTRRLLRPQEQVKEEEGGEDDARDENGSQGDVELPLLALHRLIDPGRSISTNKAENGVQENHDGTEGPSVRRGEEPQ